MSRQNPIAIAIHGGAGTISRDKLSADYEREYHQVLGEALRAGHRLLPGGGSAVDAVAAAVVVMEDSPLFNAGRGSVFTHDGRHELDASVMSGRDLAAGAVAGVSRVRNPVNLAVVVMNRSEHVMLAGSGAEEFASECGFELCDPQWFSTRRRWQQLQRVLAHGPDELRLSEDPSDEADGADDKFGTVGAVALDRDGHVAAATSTGGMTNKRYGRIGDTPIIGAGTYADDAVGAISATGHGEYFIRVAVAHDICARVRYRGLSLQQAADEVVQQRLVEIGGDGGVVGIDPRGTVVFSFNSSGMYRGFIDRDGNLQTAIFSA